MKALILYDSCALLVMLKLMSTGSVASALDFDRSL